MAAAAQIASAWHDPERNPGLRTELDFILHCCGNLLSGKNRRQEFATTTDPADGGRIIALAEIHGVLPLLCRALLENPAKIDGATLAKARYLESVNARRALLLTQELLRVVEHFNEQKISVLPYKGPVLSQLLYGDVTRRQAGDIDLLVKTCDVARATDALCALGYRPHRKLPPAQQRWYLHSGYESVFESNAGKNVLELKWRILPQFYAIDFDAEELFSHSQTLKMGGKLVHTFSPEDLVLVLSVHAAKHVWAKLGWLCDIAQMAKSMHLDWQVIECKARALRIERILALNFLLAERLLGADIPERVSSYIKSDGATRPLAEKLVSFLLRGEQYDMESFSYFGLMTKMRERTKDHASFWWRLGTTPGINEWSALKLPRPFTFLYRGVRFYRLARRIVSSKRQSAISSVSL
jgi:putative nucleotidyltransferase-like protein